MTRRQPGVSDANYPLTPDRSAFFTTPESLRRLGDLCCHLADSIQLTRLPHGQEAVPSVVSVAVEIERIRNPLRRPYGHHYRTECGCGGPSIPAGTDALSVVSMAYAVHDDLIRLCGWQRICQDRAEIPTDQDDNGPGAWDDLVASYQPDAVDPDALQQIGRRLVEYAEACRSDAPHGPAGADYDYGQYSGLLAWAESGGLKRNQLLLVQNLVEGGGTWRLGDARLAMGWIGEDDGRDALKSLLKRLNRTLKRRGWYVHGVATIMLDRWPPVR